MRTMSESEEWVELASGYDKDSVKVVAQAELARVGLSPDDLTNEQLKLDIGLDTDFKDFYRVCVHKSIAARFDQTE